MQYTEGLIRYIAVSICPLSYLHTIDDTCLPLRFY